MSQEQDKRIKHPRALTTCVAVALLAVALNPALGASKTADGPPHVIPGAEAPFFTVFENFLTQASVWYYGEPDAFDLFCREYRIDPSWPSAASLGEAGRRLEQEYLEQVRASRSPISHSADPYRWKLKTLAELFVGLHQELRDDGLPWNLRQFAALIETRRRSAFNVYSDKPFRKRDLEKRSEIFWSVVEKMDAEAAKLAESRREQ